ncbi:MAG TPA: molybdopterin-binding protein [Nitrospiraceae bacterium]|nr:molybdopterin-binding protein [Nitrospiraceae bacterium]
MCETGYNERERTSIKTIPVTESIGMVLAHDVTEIIPNEFKGRAFKKGHIVKKEDVCHLQRLGKEKLFVLTISEEEMHEDEAAYALAYGLQGEGVALQGEPKEGKINLIAERDGLLKVENNALLQLNMLGDVMCATLHSNSFVRKGQVVAGTRAIPLVVKKGLIQEAARNMQEINGCGVIAVKELRRPRAGVVITGNEVFYGRIQDAFAPIISQKIEAYGGEVVGIYYAPDDASVIQERLRELLDAGADLLITTGGMSVDPDDVTRFAIRDLGADDIVYGSPVLPGAMFLIAYLRNAKCGIRNSECTSSHSALHTLHSEIPILGIPACGMYHQVTIFDRVLPRVLAGEHIGRKELAALGHGGLCLHCEECRYPVCPFGA